MVAQVERILAETGLEPRYLELELTESKLMDDVQGLTIALNRIKRLGVSLAIDDFGTGYSSLSYLKSLPFDKIKIDRSFLTDIEKGSDAQAIVLAILAMAGSLKLIVLAEGVETAEQALFLREHGCQEMQGYYFSKPLPLIEITSLLAKGSGLDLIQ